MKQMLVLMLLNNILLSHLCFGVEREELGVRSECKVLFVADLSDRAPPSQTQTILSSMNEVFNGAAANNLNISMAFWRYSKGGDFDGPVPTTFVYTLEDVVFNFALPGGPLDIGYATDSLSSWAVQDVVVVLFTGSDPSKFPAAAQNYTRKSMTVGVAVGAQTSAFAAISVKAMQPATIYQAALSLCQPNNGFTTAQPSPTVNTVSTTTTTSLPTCKALFVADLSDFGTDWISEKNLIRASVAALFDGAGNKQLNASATFWRYSSGAAADGPLPTNFFYDPASVPYNWADAGGSLTIMDAVTSLNGWSVTDAVIVLFTASNQPTINTAGEIYGRKQITVGLANGNDASPYAAYPVHDHDSNLISDAIISLCQNFPNTDISTSEGNPHLNGVDFGRNRVQYH